MDQFYAVITWILIGATAVRARTAWRSRLAQPAWLAAFIAIPALVSRGSFWPIDFLDGLLGGGQNYIFLVQCWCATFAFWWMAEAAAIDRRHVDNVELVRLRPGIPFAWCLVYTVPFFFIPDRLPTQLFFIDAHVDDPAAVVCGVLYMGGIVGICGRLIWRLRRRPARPLWFIRIGAAFVCIGSVLWVIAIVLDHLLSLGREPILWMYLGFDLFFYPGVATLGLSLIVFAVTSWTRQRHLDMHRCAMTRILHRRRVEPVSVAGGPAHELFARRAQIQDLSALRRIDLDLDESIALDKASMWLEKHVPQIRAVGETKVSVAHD